MIQTFQRINSSDKRCLEVKFKYLEKPESDMNYDTHTFSYIDIREMLKANNEIMGLDK
jgi:hypothetical protein